MSNRYARQIVLPAEDDETSSAATGSALHP